MGPLLLAPPGDPSAVIVLLTDILSLQVAFSETGFLPKLKGAISCAFMCEEGMHAFSLVHLCSHLQIREPVLSVVV